MAPRRQARHRWSRYPLGREARRRSRQGQIMHSTLEILSEDPATAGPDLISLNDLKLALGITDTSEDAELQAAITFQSQIIADYCDRRFGLALSALETFTLDPGESVRRRE